jgi:hypothetical protein
MVHPPKHIGQCLAAGLCLVLLLGCARTAPSRFYLLTPQTQAASTGLKTEGQPTTHKIALGLGPVELPSYLDRPQIMTRTNEYQLEMSELNRWAEPLQNNIEGVLQANLSAQLATDRVLIGSWTRSRPVDFQVALTVRQFDGKLSGEAQMEVRWTLYGKDGQTVLATKAATYREPVSGKTYQDLVAAESRLLAALSREIATAIQGATR